MNMMRVNRVEDDCPDKAYDEFRQYKVDTGECMHCERKHLPDHPYCAVCKDEEKRAKLGLTGAKP